MATLIKDKKDVHFSIYKKYRAKNQVSAKRIKEFLQPILDAEKFLVTKVAREDDVRFIEHLGFERLGSTMDGISTFILNEIRYPRCKHGNKIQTT